MTRRHEDTDVLSSTRNRLHIQELTSPPTDCGLENEALGLAYPPTDPLHYRKRPRSCSFPAGERGHLQCSQVLGVLNCPLGSRCWRPSQELHP